MTVFTRYETERFAGLSAELRRIAAELRNGTPAPETRHQQIAQRIEGYARAIDEDLSHSLPA